MNDRDQHLIDKICRLAGPMRAGADRLAFEAKIWRAVVAEAPSMSAAETVAFAEKIIGAYAQIERAGRRSGGPQPREAA